MKNTAPKTRYIAASLRENLRRLLPEYPDAIGDARVIVSNPQLALTYSDNDRLVAWLTCLEARAAMVAAA